MPDVTMIPVKSSNVESIGYDNEQSIVHVKFLNGGTYLYRGVQKAAFEGLRNAESAGSYLNKNFKGVYRCDKI